ncbi:protoporphyrinogen oxidase HemJ [Venenivibrio stagnispumantis]|uniref:Protoporphyrinogen IX oxidase n=1 Tax=Venenivibrio stagnispumantis TaxID=407998 RepID=A0AA45WKH9_9AQUI|nr:protoporphyrinogen oxidase HemJ [Venenivibrio stagnispumantis]MCW4573031.1 protoporphyrinogen oxidase HemJ [Venenivibrio stagnispumantis]SMP07648.1 putative membrane protein [Venenivibrio stagnispumantis]
MVYIWIKAIHIIFVISWMAVLFYLPRLFVYHAENKDNDGFVKVVKIMEKKLFYVIGIPAFVITLITGIAMIILNPELFKSGGWLHAKLTAVALLIGFFIHNEIVRRRFEKDLCNKSGKFFRIYNEIPTILMIIIVILVIVKPF